MARRRFKRASWTYCDQCGKATTNIAKSIQGGLLTICCSQYVFREGKPLSFFEYDFERMSYPTRFQEIIEEMQISYGIAWGVE